MLTTLAVALSLAVPYLPQTDALCGGAAAAMVFRYWGDTHADVEQFAPLVDKRAGGIADDVLVQAIAARGWRARRFVGSVKLLVEQIENGRPVLILLADRGPLNHYLVVTGVEDDAAIVHDPSWGPARRIPFDELVRVWRPTNFWALEILPGAEVTRTVTGVPERAGEEHRTLESAGPPTACDRLLDDAVNAARANPASAYQLLDAVRAQCSAGAAPLREMAGVRFSERRWRDAERLAQQAVERDADDAYTWELLASSRFLQDDLAGALRAWNQLGKPLINLVKIEGLAHARFQTIAAVMGLQPNQLLTERAFRLASRRLQDLPDRAATRLTFVPEPDGFVTVTAAITERRGPPRGVVAWTAAGLQTALEREARATIPGSTGQAELWSASWRWWDGRPRVAVGFAVPRTDRLRGTWRLGASWESQTYTTGSLAGSAAAPFDEARSHGALTISNWLGPDLRYSFTAGVEAWRGGTFTGRTLLAGGSLERRWLDDRWSAVAQGIAWFPASGGPRFHTAGAAAAFKSSPARRGWVFLTDTGIERASAAAPLAIWPGAGDGHSRATLLRAHPLLDRGAIDLDGPSVFGRTVVYGHAEAQRWFASATPVRVAVAAFADTAAAFRRVSSANRAGAQIDLGAGARIAIPGAAGTLRFDVAHGMRDGRNAVTFGWQF